VVGEGQAAGSGAATFVPWDYVLAFLGMGQDHCGGLALAALVSGCHRPTAGCSDPCPFAATLCVLLFGMQFTPCPKDD